MNCTRTLAAKTQKVREEMHFKGTIYMWDRLETKE